MNVFDLFAKLSLDTSEYEERMSDSEERAEKAGLKIGQGLRTAGKVGVAAITAVGTATVAMGTALVNSAGETASYGDSIDKMSQKLGMSAEAYQEWDAIMQHSGSSIDSMLRGMTTLSSAVENGSDAFGALGISLEDAASMSQEELFSATITALQNMESGTERTVLAQKLLGGSAKELGALLNTSAEDTEAMRQRVHDLGGVMSNEAVAAAAHYQDSLQDMQTAFHGLSRGLTSEFLPGITTVMDGLSDVFSGNGDSGLSMISSGINSVLDTLTEQLPQFITFGVNIINTLATAVIDNLPLFSDAAIQIILSLGSSIISNLPMLIDAAVEIIFSLSDGIIKALPTLIPAVVAAILTITEKLTEPSTLMELIQAAFQIIGAVAQGLINAIPQIVRAVPTIIMNLIEALLRFLPQIAASGLQLMIELALGIGRGVANVIQGVMDVMNGVQDAIRRRISDAWTWGRDLIQNFINGIAANAHALWDTVRNVGQGIANFLGFSEPKEGPLSNFHTYAPDMMKLFAKGVRDNEDMLYNTVADAFDFGDVTVNSARNASGAGAESPIPIIVQAVLDGRVISETVTKYQRNKARAYG